MEPEYKILGVFFLGVLAQLSLMSRFWRSEQGVSQKLIPCFLFSLIVFIPWENEPVYTLSTHLMYSFVVFSCASAWKFRKEVLPKIDEQSILQITIVLWYFFIIDGNVSYYIHHGAIPLSLLFRGAVLLCITLPVLVVAVTPYILRPVHKVFFYIYFLLAIMYLSIPNIKFVAQTMSLVDSLQFDKVSLFDTFVSGGFFFYLLAHVVYILMLIPFKQSWKEVKEYAGLIIEKYDDTQLHIYDTVLIVVVQSGLLFLNYRFKFVNEFMMIYLSIVIMQSFVSWKQSNKTAKAMALA